jgi:DNA ligase (NAD+)
MKADTHIEFLDVLRYYGLKTPRNVRACRGIDAVITACKKIESDRDSYSCELDGAVVKVNRFELQDRLGALARSPRWAIACKFKSLQATTKLTDISVQVGRTGALTPVAHLEPVRIGGVEIKRATLHNQDEIDRKDIRIGDTVIVQRAGDVIPEVVKVLADKRTGKETPYTLPDVCPGCGSTAVRRNDEAVMRCSNRNCPAALKESVRHFASRRAMGIDGLGVKIIEKIIDNGLIASCADIYFLDAQQLMTVEGIKEKSATNILASIERSKTAGFDRFLYALGIRHVGYQTAATLAHHFGSLDELQKADKDTLCEIKDIGPEVADSLYEYFSDHETEQLLVRFRKAGIVLCIPDLQTKSNGPLTGKKVVFTGTLQSITREEAKKKLAAAGGRAVSAVSNETDYVVLGENPGKKYRAAQELGIPVIEEKRFFELLDQD